MPTSSLVTVVRTGETFSFFQLNMAARDSRRCFVAGLSLAPCESPCLPGSDEDGVWGTAGINKTILTYFTDNYEVGAPIESRRCMKDMGMGPPLTIMVRSKRR